MYIRENLLGKASAYIQSRTVNYRKSLHATVVNIIPNYIYTCTLLACIVNTARCRYVVAVLCVYLYWRYSVTFSFNMLMCTGGEDYDGGIFSIVLESSSSFPFECAVITISSDLLIENAERFNVIVTTSADFATVSDGQGVVVITGEKVRIGFEQDIYVTSEMRGSVTVCAVVGNGILDFSLSAQVVISGFAIGKHVHV